MEQKRSFVHEHPLNATSWKLPRMQELRSRPGVYEVIGDQCMYGQVARDRNGKPLGCAKKPTRFLTNSWWIAQELSRRCDGSHEHVQLLEGRAKRAAEYPVVIQSNMPRAIEGKT